ncbi:2-oxoacid-dependent dioxygenase [Selaginella moellendorffii]|uniref:2-oxoacid-dependent dioxygenase n=1 Tax=Selaginella moellendorffii TaxID=88036 RepID=D8SIJ4_SELML|nr:protein DMR6-LIKE OXYGENASE 2 [Selaginella moellendorffii]EFJ15876.1 2-oxoacid-dependent dioxygenase [Selaginella moellendorffii]|eukprot:XP_002983067.1 protein DMR6-LIKE OXYGENASE 2 [Selaginella moellendorffii]
MVYAQAVPVPTLVEQGVTKVPEAYVCFSDGFSGEVQDEERIPVIDLLDLESSHGRQRIVGEIERASREWGFFQVTNHGVSEETMEGIVRAALEFFGQPMEQRMELFSGEPKMNGTRYGTRLDETGVQDWRDFLVVGKCHPLSEETFETWPSNPPSFRSAAVKYCQEIRALAFKVISLASESLGLRPDRLEREFDPLDQLLLFNRYLPCPQPDLVLGVRSHCDQGLLNILLIDDVPGLQMRKNEESPWVPINTNRRALVVNFGDQMQIATNKRYKSFEHRVLANPERARLSISSFFNPAVEATIKPLPEFVDADHPSRYRPVSFGEYVKIYMARRLRKGTPESLES